MAGVSKKTLFESTSVVDQKHRAAFFFENSFPKPHIQYLKIEIILPSNIENFKPLHIFIA
jgi:hypothetical protein